MFQVVASPAIGVGKVTVDVATADGRIEAIAHDTRACVLTQASAALLAGSAIGRDATGLAALADSLRAMLNAALWRLARYAAAVRRERGLLAHQARRPHQQAPRERSRVGGPGPEEIGVG